MTEYIRSYLRGIRIVIITLLILHSLFSISITFTEWIHLQLSHGNSSKIDHILIPSNHCKYYNKINTILTNC